MMADATPLIRAEAVGIRRGHDWLLHEFSLTVAPGEIVTLIGPNGSGKTTAAKLMAGILTPDKGSITRPKDLTVGYVPQKIKISPTMPLTVRRLLTLTRRFSSKLILAKLALTGAGHLLNRPLIDLSGGELQRVLLARAMLGNPKLLILDEPTQGVDINGEIDLYNRITAARDETGCAILMISHDLHLVLAQSDKVICLNTHICCTGSPQAIVNDPNYQQLFGRRTAETLAIYHHHHDHTHLPDGRIITPKPTAQPVDKEVGDAG